MHADMLTPLERVLLQARSGDALIEDLVRELVRTELFVPSGRPATADGHGLQPVIFDKDGVPMVACFTLLERLADVSSLAPHHVEMRGRALLRSLPPGHGLVINPRQEPWFDLSPEGVALAVAELA